MGASVIVSAPARASVIISAPARVMLCLHEVSTVHCDFFSVFWVFVLARQIGRPITPPRSPESGGRRPRNPVSTQRLNCLSRCLLLPRFHRWDSCKPKITNVSNHVPIEENIAWLEITVNNW